MLSTQIFTGLPIILTAISLIITIVVLIRQRQFQEDITTLQNKLTARREIATTKLGYLTLMEKWVDDGLEIRKEVLPLESFLNDLDAETEYVNVDPKTNFSKINKMYWDWLKTSEKLIALAQIYDSNAKENVGKWNSQFDGNLPENLPDLFEFYKKCLLDFIWNQKTRYEDVQDPYNFPFDPERDEMLAEQIPNAGQYIIPAYQKIHITLETVKERVVTEKLS